MRQVSRDRPSSRAARLGLQRMFCRAQGSGLLQTGLTTRRASAPLSPKPPDDLAGVFLKVAEGHFLSLRDGPRRAVVQHTGGPVPVLRPDPRRCKTPFPEGLQKLTHGGHCAKANPAGLRDLLAGEGELALVGAGRQNHAPCFRASRLSRRKGAGVVQRCHLIFFLGMLSHASGRLRIDSRRGRAGWHWGLVGEPAMD